MQGGSRQKGFTVVETIIVLAVTATLFIAAVAAVGGKQGRTQFSAGIRDIESRMQQTINEVSSGYFPSSTDFKCQKVGAAPSLSAAVNNEQGSNTPCIFLGKVIQFGVDNGSADESMNIYSAIGVRVGPSGPVTTITDARPRVLARNAADLTDAAVPDNLYDKVPMPYGISTDAMYYDNNTANTIGAIGFVSHLGSTLDSPDGSQQVDVIVVSSTELNKTKDAGVAKINSKLPTTTIFNPANGIQLCFRSGTSDQSALMTIGGGGKPLGVSTIIRAGDCS